MENYAVFLLYVLIAGAFAALGFYLGRIYQIYLINKENDKPSQDNNLTEKLKRSAEEMSEAMNKLISINRKLEDYVDQLEEKCRRLEQQLREK